MAKGKKHRVECVKVNERAVEKKKGGWEEGLRKDQRSVRDVSACSSGKSIRESGVISP